MALTITLSRELTVELIRLIIAYYLMKYKRGISTEILVKFLFLILYTDSDGQRLLDAPRIRLPEEFRIYLKGPFVPIEKLLADTRGVLKGNDKYYVGNISKTYEEALKALEEEGLGDVAKYALKIVDIFGELEEEDIIRHTLNLLKLRDDFVKAMSFNMSLDAYLETVKKLKKIMESREVVDEEELYPELFK